LSASTDTNTAAAAAVEDALSFQSILRALDEVEIPEQDTRNNVRRVGGPSKVRSISTGVVPARNTTGIQLAVHSKRRPKLTRLLVAFARAHIPDQRFCFNAITINEGFASAMHTDKFNLGPSYIVALGDFQGIFIDE
jgi:hypothetical protein